MAGRLISDERLAVWFFRCEGTTFGPISTAQVGNLLRSGGLRPHQAVWKRDGTVTIFVRAAQATQVPVDPAPLQVHSTLRSP